MGLIMLGPAPGADPNLGPNIVNPITFDVFVCQ